MRSSWPPEMRDEGLQASRDALEFELAQVMKPEFIPTWLKMPQAQFDNRTPLEVLESDDPAPLWHCVFLLGSGLPV